MPKKYILQVAEKVVLGMQIKVCKIYSYWYVVKKNCKQQSLSCQLKYVVLILHHRTMKNKTLWIFLPQPPL